MPLPGFKKAFDRLPIPRQILIQWLGLMVMTCLLLSLGAALIMKRHLEREMQSIARDEAGQRLDLVDYHLRSLEEEVLRIARHSNQSHSDHKELRSALIVDFMLRRESRGLIFTNAAGQVIHSSRRGLQSLQPQAILEVLGGGRIVRHFHLDSRSWLLIVPVRDGKTIVGAIEAQLDLTAILERFFDRKNTLIYTFEQNGQSFFQTASAPVDPAPSEILSHDATLLREMGIRCRYQAHDPQFKQPLRKMLIVLLIISSALIILAAGVSMAIGHHINHMLQNMTDKLIQNDDEFVAKNPENELEKLGEAISFHQDKTQSQTRALEKTRDEALRATQTKSEFLANMSHEIRAPMNGVLGMAQLMRFTEMTAEQRKYVDAIIDAGDSLMGIINDILDFSKIEAGHFQIDYQDFDLRRCLQNTVQIFEVKAKEKGLELILDIKADVPRMIRGDDQRLRQILNNLISNAIKFTAKGQVVIHVQVQEQPQDKMNISISVQDTGIGIHKDDVGKLFKSYIQANSSIARRFGGTGLGLAISQALCEMMGGTIGVDSSPGRGSTFYFNLIFEKAQTLDNPASDKGRDYSRNLRILVAEDSDVNQMIIRTMFKKLGIRVDVAANGLEAIEMAATTAYDLIYMDVHMPHKEGPEAARIILAENRFHPPPRIIALTADMFKDDHRKCFEAGMIDLLMKPIQLNDLRLSLSKYGQRARSDRQPHHQAS
jgi:signal transduction histidine kinase/ActR/RegA family two-component response regulator